MVGHALVVENRVDFVLRVVVVLQLRCPREIVTFPSRWVKEDKSLRSASVCVLFLIFRGESGKGRLVLLFPSSIDFAFPNNRAMMIK